MRERVVGALMRMFKEHIAPEDLIACEQELKSGTAVLSTLSATHESARTLKFGKLLPDPLVQQALSTRWYTA